jgi:hypothetical protein
LVVLTPCWHRQKKHTEEEISFTIVPGDLKIRRTERDSERLGDTSLYVEWYMWFASNIDTEMTCTVHTPAELFALERPLEKSNRSVAERRRSKTVACGWSEGAVTRWNTILEGVIQLHVTPL